MESLVFEPVLPLRWLGLGWTLLAAAVAVYALGRRATQGWVARVALALAHAVVPAGLLFLLHGPTWVELKPQDGKRPPFVVLVDRSASMSAESGAGATRFEHARSLVAKYREEWDSVFTLRESSFDQRVYPGERGGGAAPDGAMTNLAAAIDDGILSGAPPAAALIFSDGIHNATDSDPLIAARRARAVGCPIYTVTLGSDAAVKDLGLQLAQSEGLTFVRQPFRAIATLSFRGYSNVEAKIQVRLAKKVVQERAVPVNGTGEVRVDLDLAQEKPGLYEYEIAVAERPDEVFRTNNRQRLALRVVDERIRVLVLEGKPYWDSKFLLQALKRDANVAVSSLVRVTDTRSVWDAAIKGLTPKDLERPLEDRGFLESFQVVVLCRDVDVFLSPAAVGNLKEWISRRGGHLVAARGRPVGPRAAQEQLLSILPLQWAEGEERRFRLELTERGRMMTLFGAAKKDAAAKLEDPRVVMKELPQLVTATRVEKERALAVVLARGQGDGPTSEMAALTFQQYGAGRVVVLEGQALWRWAFQAPESAGATNSIFEGFWSNTIRWLAGSNEFLPSQFLALRVSKPSFLLDERPVVYVLQRALPAGATKPVDPLVEIVREEGPPDETRKFPIRLQPEPVQGDATLRRASVEPLPEGRYRVRLLDGPGADAAVAAEALFDVTPPLQERLDLRARPELMKRIAQASDGEALTPATLSGLRDAYLRYVARFRPDLELRTPAWDHPLLWVAMTVWLALLWLLRRRWGMI